MIGLLVRLPLALALLVPLGWGAVLLGSGGERALLAGAEARLRDAYPSQAVRVRLLGAAVRAASELRVPPGDPGAGRPGPVRPGLVALLLELEVALRVLPLAILSGILGLTSGLLFRERMKEGEGYASPTAAGLGRGGVGAGILGLALLGLCPLPVSFGWMYLSPLAILLGGSLWAANLPPRL